MTGNAQKLSADNADNKMPKSSGREITTHFCEEAIVLAGQFGRTFYDALLTAYFSSIHKCDRALYHIISVFYPVNFYQNSSIARLITNTFVLIDYSIVIIR